MFGGFLFRRILNNATHTKNILQLQQYMFKTLSIHSFRSYNIKQLTK